MTAQPVEAPTRPAMPKRELGAIVHAIEAHADPEVVGEFEADLTDVAQQVAGGDSGAVERLVERWWGWARLWTVAPQDARRSRAGILHVDRHGLDSYRRSVAG